MTNRKNALPPSPSEPSLFDPPDLDELAEVSLTVPTKEVPSLEASSAADLSRVTPIAPSVPSVALPASPQSTTPSPQRKRRRKSPTKALDPEKPTTPASAMRPASRSGAAKERRKKRHWRSGLETDIKTEALTLFQKGEDVESVARSLMLPRSAVTSWYDEYQRGILLASERTLSKAQEPTLF